MPLTAEQTAVVEASLDRNDTRILAVNAKAGSGKSSTLRAIVEAYKPKNGLVTSFNKAISEDTKKKIGNLIPCSTTHALAYKYIKPKSIEDFNYLSIKEDVSYDDKKTIIETLDNFYRSSSTDLNDYLDVHCKDTYLQELITKYANAMLDGQIPVTFNFMLKCLHLMLYYKELDIDMDFFAIDEAQDSTAVTLEIFKLVNANKKIVIGDEFQNIYSFMDTVNAFTELENLNELYLTKSFRCNPEIAQEVEIFGKRYLEPKFKFRGNSKIKKLDNLEIAYITRTNASLIERMYNLIQNHRAFTLTRPINDIFALPMALMSASTGRPVYDKRYKYLEFEYKNYERNRSSYMGYFDYIVHTTNDPILESLIKTLQRFKEKGINLYTLKEKVTNMKPNPNTVLTTAHAFKGLEMDTAYIEDDLNNCAKRAIKKKNLSIPLDTSDQEDLNTYYVGLSRAKNTLVNVDYLGV